MKKWVNSFLKKIEEANQKNFGSGPMDCCDLNSKNSNRKSNESQHSDKTTGIFIACCFMW